MTQEKTSLNELELALIELRSRLEEARLSVDDQLEPHILADRLEAALLDLLGDLQTAIDAAASDDAVSESQALSSCQQHFNLAQARFFGELLSLQWMQELEQLARERPEQWQGWAESVSEALEKCSSLFLLAPQELFLRCWMELVEYSTILIRRNDIYSQQPFEQRVK